MNVTTDLKIEKTEYPLTGEVEYRIKKRVPVFKINWKILKKELIGEKWVLHPNVEEDEWTNIWSDCCSVFTDFEKAQVSLIKLKNHYLRKTFKTEII